MSDDAIAQREWQWFGLPGHFCCAADCLFHMTTQVGGKLVSSVGAYAPDYETDENEDGFVNIGAGRKYESFVFETGEGQCDCGCGMPEVENYLEIDSLPANTAAECQQNHMKLCEKWANEEATDES